MYGPGVPDVGRREALLLPSPQSESHTRDGSRARPPHLYLRRRRALGEARRLLSRSQTTAMRNMTRDMAMKFTTWADSAVRAKPEATSASRKMASTVISPTG